MYILFINSSSKCDIFFSAQFNNNNNNKNCPTQGFNPTHVGWVGLGWVEFFLTHHDGLGQKIPSTQPMHTLMHKYTKHTQENCIRKKKTRITKIKNQSRELCYQSIQSAKKNCFKIEN